MAKVFILTPKWGSSIKTNLRRTNLVIEKPNKEFTSTNTSIKAINRVSPITERGPRTNWKSSFSITEK